MPGGNTNTYMPPHMKRGRGTSGNSTPTPVPSHGHYCHQAASPSHPQAASTSRPVPRIGRSRHLIHNYYATSTESIALIPYNGEAIKMKDGSKPLMLAVTGQTGLIREEERWALMGIVENVARDLIEGAQYAKNEKNSEDAKLVVMGRVGKVLFRDQGDQSFLLDLIKKTLASKEKRMNLMRAFHTNISVDYIRKVDDLLLKKFEFQSEMAKESFHIKVVDNRQPNLIFSCKCRVSHDGKLKLYKVEHNPLCIHMVTDVSCVSKNMDLQIMLNTKRTVKNLDEDVESCMHELISMAADKVLEVKRGLKWDLWKRSVEDRFSIVDVWHTVKRTLSRDKISICLRKAEHHDKQSSTGEDANEVSFKLHGLSELLTEDYEIKEDSIVDKIQEVSLIWDNFLS